MGFKLGGEKSNAPNSEINVTPLIDIMLVLLIIFMIAMPRMVNEMAMNLPSKTETKKKENDSKPKQLMVAIYEDERLALNREYMTKQELAERLTAEMKGRESKVIFVDAHPDLNYNYVVEIFDLVRDAGPEKVGLARVKDQGPAKPSEEGSAAPEGAAADPGAG
ncbi:MAG: biopolymer transporter ExbD [Myxococcota bacterium]|jgi:biopolymer transport protein ExbD|nr:biopolymer transporter ExbD [Myxococcota bacterium]